MWLTMEVDQPIEASPVRTSRLDGPRIFLYSHDTYGLGHFRRNLLLARAIARGIPDASVLCATGSPRSHSFPLPPNFDYLKLPSTTKDGKGGYRARTLGLTLPEIARLRARLLREAMISFRPDLVLVDHAPLGMEGELRPALRALRRRFPSTGAVLGLRDIVDAADRVRASWSRPAVRNVLEDLYDRILVYGSAKVFDLPREYGFSPRVRAKTRFVGYLAPDPVPAPPERTRAALGLGRLPVVLVIVGGGGDGAPLLRTYIRALDEGAAPGFESVLVTGPLLSAEKRARIRASATGRARVRLLDFAANVPDLVRAADVVVSMAGYNATCEILWTGTKSILVPRTQPRLEQQIRAMRLAALGLVRALPPDDLSPARLREEVERALAAPRPPGPCPLEFQGAEEAVSEFRSLLRRPVPAAVSGNGRHG
ncbi:MAG TPA: glycosyltransferase [Planctomycetota bacterium]|jgi:predicted glycosyltransferase|nr:glycosyltransferase [Planctomycetota bacterium]